MDLVLNSKQCERLSDFFFDVAKGLVLGGIGFATVAPQEFKLIYSLISSIISFWCVKVGLKLLEL